MIRPIDNQERFRLARGVEELPGHGRWDDTIVRATDDEHRAGRDRADDIERTHRARMGDVQAQREQGTDLRGVAAPGVLGASLLDDVRRRGDEDHGSQAGVHRGNLRGEVAARRETVHADALGIDVGLRGHEIDSRGQGRALGAAPGDLALALSLSRPIEEQHAEAGTQQDARVGQAVRPVAAGAVCQDDRRAVLRRNVPAAESRTRVRREGDVAQAERHGILGARDAVVAREVELALERVHASSAHDLPEHEPTRDEKKDARGVGHRSAGEESAREKREGDGVLFIVRGGGCKANSSVFLRSVVPSLRTGAECQVVAAEILDGDRIPDAIRSMSDDAFTIPVPPALRGASPRRLAGFIAGRYCAMHALRRAGYAHDSEIGMGSDRAPIWPDGFVGSITHSHRFAMGAAARRCDMRGLGIDCEALIAASTVDEIAPRLLTPVDRVTFERDCAAHLGWREFATLTFSAKESLYKCLQPITGVFFEFADAQITAVDIAGRRMTLQLVRPLSPEFGRGAELQASFHLADGYVWTAVELPNASLVGGRTAQRSVRATSCIESRSVR